MKKIILLTSIIILYLNYNSNAQNSMYEATGVCNGIELITNSDFSLGNSGFTSDYAYCNSANCLFSDLAYAVGSDPTFFHNQFQGNDHTTGTGNFMIINGATSSNKNVWCETINVDPNTTYN